MSSSKTKTKSKTMSDIEFMNIYHNNDSRCRDTLFAVLHPEGYTCPECGCTHFTYLITRKSVLSCSHCSHQTGLFAGTIFQDNKLAFFTLLFGIHIFTTIHNGMSAENLANRLGVNRKTAQLLTRKLRYLMELNNEFITIESSFIEVDAFFYGSPSKNGKRGKGTDQQSIEIALGTTQEDNYPEQVMMRNVRSENKKEIQAFFNDYIVTLSKTITIKCDGDRSYNWINEEATLKSGVIDYTTDNKTLHWLNTIISNFKSNVDGIYFGIAKKYLGSFEAEYVWRFNHRNHGRKIINAVSQLLGQKVVMTRKMFKALYMSV